MEGSSGHFTEAQYNELQDVLRRLEDQVYTEVHAITVETIEGRQQELLGSIRQTIAEAVSANQKAIVTVTEPQSLKKPNEDGLFWKILLVLLPIFCTTLVLGKQEQTKAVIAARINLTQEYYKAKINVYDSIYKSLDELTQVIQESRNGSISGLYKPRKNLYDLYTNKSFYIPTDIVSTLKHINTVTTSAALKGPKAFDSEYEGQKYTVREWIMKQIEQVKFDMNKDLVGERDMR